MFLDEIGELPLDAQVRLLRILQDGTFERVGGQKTLRVDVRIVAATHRDLAQMVADGTFREDLWYRIGIFPIALPPLRDRPEDVPTLASHFARRAGVRLGGSPLTLTSADIEMLLADSWPGNARELAAVIERAAILGRGHGSEIAAALGIGGHPPRQQLGERVEIRPTVAGIRRRAKAPRRPSRLTRRCVITSRTHCAPQRAGSRGRSGAAVRLGVNPHTLRGRMRRLGIIWGDFRARRTAPSEISARPKPGARQESGPPLEAGTRGGIEAALSASHGRVEGPFGAAARLRMNPHTLRTRIHRLGINPHDYRVRPVPRAP